jgi:uncharacterized damage-inducible protein DinB
MSTRAATLLDQFRTTNYVLQLAFSDLDQDTAIRRLSGDAGPSIAWEIGHVMFYRVRIIVLLGHKYDFPYKETFEGDANDGSTYPLLNDFASQWKKIAEALESALKSATDEQLDGPIPTAGPHDERTMYDLLTFLCWHEAYHAGQLGSIRTHFGMPQLSKLAQQQSEAEVSS